MVEVVIVVKELKKLLRFAFEDYVLEFNAKCLIFYKYGNPEPAKALSWVVDKKMQELL